MRKGFPILPIALLGLTILLPGCVKRTIVVESEPPGAEVWINEHREGPAPVTHEFITHGRYRFRLRKAGYEELVTREMVRAPIYQWIPLDLIFEHLIPFHLEDRHVFRYSLTPLSEEERERIVAESPLQEVLAGLKDPDPKKRRSACLALARLRNPETVSVALEAAQDPDPTVRGVALEAVRSIQGIKSLDRLMEALQSDPDPEVRWAAAAGIDALKSQEAVDRLVAALKDRDPLVRTGAAEALKDIPDPRAVQPLIAALRDKDTAVRRAATEALGRIRDRAAVPALTKVLFHHDFITRRKAVEALRELRDPASGPALVRTFTDWDPKIRQIATESLIAFGDSQVVPALIRRLRGLRPWTREHAAIVLGGLKDQRAAEPLTRSFRREKDAPASKAMYDALVALGAEMDESWSQTLALRVWQADEKKKEETGQVKR